MPQILSILFPILVLVPGLLIPLHVVSRMYRVVVDERRAAAEKVFARGAMLAMLLLMGVAVYAALEIHSSLSAIAAAG